MKGLMSHETELFSHAHPILDISHEISLKKKLQNKKNRTLLSCSAGSELHLKISSSFLSFETTEKFGKYGHPSILR